MSASIVRRISWQKLDSLIDDLAPQLKGKIVYGVPRGGAIVAGIVRQRVPHVTVTTRRSLLHREMSTHNAVILDDVIETGKTMSRFDYLDSTIPRIALFDKIKHPELIGTWIHFPWEREENIPEELERFGYE